MKKILCLILTLCIFAGLFTFVGCDLGGGNSDPATVMNVSLNPEVEFVLDGNGKVITVNALNEEGNLIISAEEFEKIEGKTAEEAAQLFVQVCTDTGYIVSGSLKTENNKIEISISGDTTAATELFNDVKAKVDSYFSKENITATLQQAAAITQEELQKLVEECAPYLEEAEIKAMEYKDLLAQLAESRKETAEYYSQELKTAYYEAKAHALDKAKYDVLKTKLSGIQAIGFEATNTAYNAAVTVLENVRNEWFVSEDSFYQKALATLRQKKTEYLNFLNEVSQMEQTDLTEAVTKQLETLKAALDVAEIALENTGESALAVLDAAKAEVDSWHEKVVSALSSINVDELVDEIAEKQTSAANEFFTSFESTYAAAKQSAQDSWSAMYGALAGAENN